MSEPLPCDACGVRAAYRLSFAIEGEILIYLWLCPPHARAVELGAWSLDVVQCCAELLGEGAAR